MQQQLLLKLDRQGCLEKEVASGGSSLLKCGELLCVETIEAVMQALAEMGGIQENSVGVSGRCKARGNLDALV